MLKPTAAAIASYLSEVNANAAQLQPLADRRRRAGEERTLLQAGFMAMDPRNGHVRAGVGSTSFEQRGFVFRNRGLGLGRRVLDLIGVFGHG